MNVEQDYPHFFTKVAVDIVSLLAVSVPISIFFFVGKPYERGFFCNDDSLRHPYKDSTVPSWILYIVGLGLPITVILIVEYFIYYKIKGPRKKVQVVSKKIPKWIWECYRHIGVFFFGAACSQLTTDVAKYTIGRLRPHFFDVCKPDIDCNDPKFKFAYIEEFNCQQKNSRRLKDMRLSFPSGHSSFSAYCMVFLVVYLQVKLTWKGSKLLKHLLQYICLTLSFYTALSRISDYKHHWSDVLAGFLQGILVAVLTVCYVSDLIQKRESKDSDLSDEGMENSLQMQ